MCTRVPDMEGCRPSSLSLKQIELLAVWFNYACAIIHYNTWDAKLVAESAEAGIYLER